MQATKLTCPDCDATLQTAKPIPAGAKIKCPKCGSTFAAPAASSSPPTAKPTTKTLAAKTQPMPPKSRSNPREPIDEEDDDYEDRPRKKKKKKFREKESSSNATTIIAIVVAIVVVVGGGVVAGIYLLGGDKNDAVSQANNNANANNAGNPANRFGPGGPNRPGQGMPGGPGGQQFGPGNRPGSDSRNPQGFGPGNRPGGQPGGSGSGPGGSGFNPMAQMKFDQIDLGNVPAKQASQMDGLKYLPADCTAVGGFDVGGLVGNSMLSRLLQAGSNGKDFFGIPFSEVDHVVVGTNVPLSKFSQGKGPETGVLVIKTKSPIDAAKVRQAAEVGPAEELDGKQIYRRIKDKADFLYLPADNTVILATLPETQSAGLLGLKGDQPTLSSDMLAAVIKVGQAHAWIALSGEQLKAAQEAPSAAGAAADEQTKALNAMMAKAKSAVLAVRVWGKKLSLTGGVVCDDANASKQLVGGMQLVWNVAGKSALDGVKSKYPALAALVGEVQNLTLKDDGDFAKVALDVSYASFEPLKNMNQADWLGLAMSMQGLGNQGGGLAQGSGAKPEGSTPAGTQPGVDSPGAATPSDDNVAEGLDVGQRAPEIEGKDIDGKNFKLSDYRGKIILLDFWGHW